MCDPCETDLKQIESDVVEQIDVAQEKGTWRAFLNTGTNFRIS